MGYSAQIGLTMPDAHVNTGNIPKSNARETPPYGDTNTQGLQHGQFMLIEVGSSSPYSGQKCATKFISFLEVFILFGFHFICIYFKVM